MKKNTAPHKSTVETSSEVKITSSKSKWMPYALIGVLVVLFLLLKVVRGGSPSLNDLKTKTIPSAIKKVLNSPDAKFEVLNVKEANGLVEFELSVNNQKYTSYISRDGKILFTAGIKLDDLDKKGTTQSATNSAPKATTCNDIQKAEKPELTAFVVANCPFGLQMQRVFKKAIAENSELANSINIKYIGSVQDGKITAMHGDEEAQENLKQICIREEQKDLYWPYVNCYMQEGKTQECLTSTGVNVSELTACTSDAGRGLKYAQVDFDLANKFGVSGSPTLLSNNKQIVSEFDFGGRNANAIQQLICCASKNKPGFCSNEISKTDVAVSLSKTDDAPANTAGSTTSAAGCAPAK